MSLIKNGFAAREMEDKWHIVYSDSCLYIKNSGSWYTIYAVRFNEDAKKPTAVDICANRDPEQHSPHADDKIDKDLVTSIIDVYLLRKFKKK